jgi:hypothetical protein
VEQECIYVGAYKTSAQYTSTHKSVSGDIPLVSGTRATFRAKAKEKGSGWYMIDISTISAIQMLYLVEFANNNSQALIGRGYVDGNSAKINTGSCDVVPNLTGRPTGTDGKTDVVYRGMEGLWGNIWEYVDGIIVKSGSYYISNDPSVYGDSSVAGYSPMSTVISGYGNEKYITSMACDSGEFAHIFAPHTSTGSESSYYCDCSWSVSDSKDKVIYRGGHWSSGSKGGLFAMVMIDNSSAYGSDLGSRLIYIPQ